MTTPYWIQIQEPYRASDVTQHLLRDLVSCIWTGFLHCMHTLPVPSTLQAQPCTHPLQLLECPHGPVIMSKPTSTQVYSQQDSSQPLFLPFTLQLILWPPGCHTSVSLKSLFRSVTQPCYNRLQCNKILCLIKIVPSPSQWSARFQWQLMKEGLRNWKSVNNPLYF